MKAVFFDNCCQSAHSDAEVLHAVSRAIEEQHVNTESRIPIETSDVVSRCFAQTRTKRYVMLLIIHLARMLVSSLPLATFGAHKHKYETELYIAGKTKSLNKFHKKWKFKPLS